MVSDDSVWATVEPIARAGSGAASTLPERIAERIEALIRSGAVPPGGRLPSERELARIFAVNRLAVREAAHRLEAHGLVVVRRGAGAFVAAVPPARPEPDEAPLPGGIAVDVLFEVRRLLEPAAAEWAASRADRAAIASLFRVAESFESTAAGPRPRYDLLAATDIRLHLEIAEAADNPLLVRLLERLHDADHPRLEWSLARPGRAAEAVREHRAVLDAIAAGRPKEAREAMLAHLAAALASFNAVGDGVALD